MIKIFKFFVSDHLKVLQGQNFEMRFPLTCKAYLSVTTIVSVVAQKLRKFLLFCPQSPTFKRELE